MVARGWGRGTGSDCLVGTGFPFEVLRMFWNEKEVMAAHIANVLSGSLKG